MSTTEVTIGADAYDCGSTPVTPIDLLGLRDRREAITMSRRERNVCLVRPRKYALAAALPGPGARRPHVSCGGPKRLADLHISTGPCQLEPAPQFAYKTSALPGKRTNRRGQPVLADADEATPGWKPDVRQMEEGFGRS